MSRNKDIEFYHRVSKLPYSVCRANLKKHRWDVWEAMGYNSLFDNLPRITEAIVEALNCMMEQLSKSVNAICEILVEILNTSEYDIGYTTERGEGENGRKDTTEIY